MRTQQYKRIKRHLDAVGRYCRKAVEDTVGANLGPPDSEERELLRASIDDVRLQLTHLEAVLAGLDFDPLDAEIALLTKREEENQ